MKYVPYPFQTVAIDHMMAWFQTADVGDRRLYAAPTGCGKSIMELEVQSRLPNAWIVTPRDEIIAGMLDKLGSDDAMQSRIATPIMLRNRLLAGTVAHPSHMLFDESHHGIANSWKDVALLSGLAPSIGMTATPYRGSPRSTRQLIEYWGKPIWIVTYREADEAGYIKLPTFSILPLVDDDIVDVSGGEFEVTSLEAATVDRLQDAADHAARWHSAGLWDRPTVFALPSSSTCTRLEHELNKRGLPAITVSASTPRPTRAAAFLAAEQRLVALLHIDIISEGVDLKLRRLVDLHPTMSPVRWLQQLGRITRPTDEERPEYICTNRNIFRHAYVLDGIVPVEAVVLTERLFGTSSRPSVRALGLEALGRFKPATVPLANGLNLHVYSLSCVIGTAVVKYACVAHPTMEPIWATKIDVRTENDKKFGRWHSVEPPDGLQGFGSRNAGTVSPDQLKWWRRAASRFGLDSEHDPNRKTFEALPVLSDLGVRFT
jgi:hypothetical protein